MKTFIKMGRIFFATMLIGLACQQIYYADFRPVILADWSSHIQGLNYMSYLVTAIMLVTGGAIILDKKAKEWALISGGMFLLLFLIGHVTYELIVDLYPKHLGVWTNALKEIAFAGGAFAVAGSLPVSSDSSGLIRFLEKFIPFNRIFFALTMALFGLDHFFYPDFVASLVPNWAPGHLFLCYFAGVALILSGIAIILEIRLKTAALLLGLMIFLWLILLHIPRAIVASATDNGNELTSVFEALGFSGIALLIAYQRQAGIAV
ncbi:MAG: hypothetical protein ACTHMI_01475 [Mucilaginibacter sp.]